MNPVSDYAMHCSLCVRATEIKIKEAKEILGRYENIVVSLHVIGTDKYTRRTCEIVEYLRSEFNVDCDVLVKERDLWLSESMTDICDIAK